MNKVNCSVSIVNFEQMFHVFLYFLLFVILYCPSSLLPVLSKFYIEQIFEQIFPSVFFDTFCNCAIAFLVNFEYFSYIAPVFFLLFLLNQDF